MSGMAKDSSNGDKKQYWRPCGSSPAGGGKLLMEPHPCPWFTFIIVLVKVIKSEPYQCHRCRQPNERLGRPAPRLKRTAQNLAASLRA